MIRRVLPSCLLALCLVLTSLASVVAQTRMAAAGGYCGAAQPAILVDATGMPLMDGDGRSIDAPGCPVCHLTLATGTPPPPAPRPAIRLAARIAGLPTPCLAPLSVRLSAQARAPPVA